MSVYDQLKALNIELPPVRTPAAAYSPFAQTGNLVFISGHTASKNGNPGRASWARTSTPPKASWLRVPLPLT